MKNCKYTYISYFNGTGAYFYQETNMFADDC